MLHVKIWSLLLITLIISGCTKEVQVEVIKVVKVPQKCEIPYTQYPSIDNTAYDSINDIIAKALSNYTKMKEYSEKLLANQEVCK